MADDKFNGLDFNFGSDTGFNEPEEIYSSSKGAKGKEFEDLYSNSKTDPQVLGKLTDSDFIALDSVSKRKYRKKQHGVIGFFKNIGYAVSDWWSRRKTWQKALLISATAIILILAILYGYIGRVFDRSFNDDKDNLGINKVIDDKIINVALFGLDTRGVNSFSGNSDSIMILSINTKSKKVKVMSVMRDSLVPIERNGKITYSKINAAYGWGGPELAVKTLNQNFNLDISDYATVNFYGMVDIIDAVGGIEATITEDELYDKGPEKPGLNGCMGEICKYLGLNVNKYKINKAGTQHLNGVQAVAYSRIRYCKSVWDTSNDYGRTDRQRHVMQELFNKATKLKKSQYISLANALIPCTKTSMSTSEILSIAASVLLNSPQFEQYRIPQNEFLMPAPSGSFGSVLYYDLDFVSKLIHGIIYDDMTVESYIEANGIGKTPWYKAGSYVKKPGTVSSPSSSSSSRPSSSSSSLPSSSSPSSSQETDSTPSSKPNVPENPDPVEPSEPVKPTDPVTPNPENPEGLQ